MKISELDMQENSQGQWWGENPAQIFFHLCGMYILLTHLEAMHQTQKFFHNEEQMPLV